MHNYRRAAVAIFAEGASTQLIERVEQVADWPLAHALDAVQSECTMPERRERRQEADRRPAVRAKQLCLERGHFTTGTVHNEGSSGVARFDRNAQPPEALYHYSCV